MRKITIMLLALVLISSVSYADEVELFVNFMSNEGLERNAALEIYETMPVEEQIAVLSILMAKNNNDLDELPPLKSQYEDVIYKNPASVNLIDVLFEDNNRRSNDNSRYYHNGAKWYYENNEIRLDFNRGDYIEYIEMRWHPESWRSTVQLVVDGYTYADEKVVRGTQKFDINSRVDKEIFFIVRGAPVYVYNDYIKYDNFWNNNNNNSEYGYDFIQNVYVNNSTYVDIDKTISDFKIKINNGRANIETVFMYVNNREYRINVDKTVYAGSSFDHELPKEAFVEYLRIEWNDANFNNRTDASIFVKQSYSSNNPAPANPGQQPVPSYIRVSAHQVTGPSQAQTTFSGYSQINQSDATGQKVVEKTIDDFRAKANREGLRAMSRGNFIIRRISSNTFRVIWW
ncbi:MAG: hypothetical protein ACQESP_09565 [Candidatus Muiribacteriota bacterium]